ncbi:MAG: TrmB family transcriptional regulator [archaeon GB-1867-005]|nr:TrmB family transcriptional regulator [Candidatus Culexmicrobium cathedralense]
MESLIGELRKLGLTNYEARAYITLVERGAMTAGSLSKASKIPYSKIYDVLSRLEEKGWIIIERGKPNKYKARPPSEAAKMAIKRIESELKKVERIVVRELQPLYERIGVQEKPEVIILRGAPIIVEKAVTTIENAARELEVAIPGEMRAFHQQFKSSFEGAVSRGVKVKVLASKEHRDLLEPLFNLGVEIGLRDKLFGGGLIADDEEAVILLSGGALSPLAIWSNHSELVKLAKIYFEYLWRDAEKLTG